MGIPSVSQNLNNYFAKFYWGGCLKVLPVQDIKYGQKENVLVGISSFSK